VADLERKKTQVVYQPLTGRIKQLETLMLKYHYFKILGAIKEIFSSKAKMEQQTRILEKIEFKF
jgi:hypothetical protein